MTTSKKQRELHATRNLALAANHIRKAALLIEKTDIPSDEILEEFIQLALCVSKSALMHMDSARNVLSTIIDTT